VDRAAGLAAELLGGWAPVIRDLRLVPSTGGRFEVTLDDDLIFSKKAVGRHAEPGEVAGEVRSRLGAELLGDR
jgi:selenoprotein W-related protein